MARGAIPPDLEIRQGLANSSEGVHLIALRIVVASK